MISLINLSKTYRMKEVTKSVLRNVTMDFPSRTSVGLLGRNGAGKSTLLKMIAGTQVPSSGHIRRIGTVSWPVGFSGSFHLDLTGVQNCRYVARIYGIDSDELVEFAREFTALGPHFNLPIRTYSSGMRSRLAFGISMGVPFDTYLVDEVTAVGDAAFRKKSDEVFRQRMTTSGAIVVNHSISVIRELCSAVAVLSNGKLSYFEDVGEGIHWYEKTISSN